MESEGFEGMQRFIQNYIKSDGTKLNLDEFIQKNIDEDNCVLVVDRIEESYAVCENRDSKEIINIELKSLPENIREGSVLKKIDGKYVVDLTEQKKIEDRIKSKMDKLWK